MILLPAGGLTVTAVQVPSVRLGAGSAVAEVSVATAVAICVKLIVSPVPSESAATVLQLRVTEPALLSSAAVSVPLLPATSPPVPGIAVPLPTCVGVGAKVIRSTVATLARPAMVVYGDPVPTRR